MSQQYETVSKVLKPIKMLLYGPTHSGKTFGALRLAVGMVMETRQCVEADAYQHILMIDTEYRRGTLYSRMGPYKYVSIDAPYETEKLVAEITHVNADPMIDVVIIDSITHFWVKAGGILEQKTLKDAEGGNTYTNWNIYSAKFNKALDTVLSSPKMIITTARAKTDRALVVNEKGKQAPVTYGLKPEIRDDVDYEFDIVFNIDKLTHTLLTDKGLPDMELTYPLATPELGGYFLKLASADATVPARTIENFVESVRTLAKNNNLIVFVQLKLNGRKITDLKLEELTALELDLLNEIKAKQIK